MRVAHALARSEQRDIEATDVFQALEAQEQFHSDFEAEIKKEGGLAPLHGLRLESGLFLAFMLVVCGYLTRLLQHNR